MINQDLSDYLILAKKICPMSPVQEENNYKDAAKQIIMNLHVLDVYIDEIRSNDRGILDSDKVITILISIQNISLHLLTELPHYKEVNFNMYVRSITEDTLRLIHYYLYENWEDSLKNNFRNLKEQIKTSELYTVNEQLKKHIDFLFSCYGSSSIEIHKLFSNGEITSSLETLWITSPPKSFHKRKDFLKKFRDSLLNLLNSIYDLNDCNLTLTSKVNLKKYLTTKEYNELFQS